jgi:hypothetical protein
VPADAHRATQHLASPAQIDASVEDSAANAVAASSGAYDRAREPHIASISETFLSADADAAAAAAAAGASDSGAEKHSGFPYRDATSTSAGAAAGAAEAGSGVTAHATDMQEHSLQQLDQQQQQQQQQSHRDARNRLQQLKQQEAEISLQFVKSLQSLPPSNGHPFYCTTYDNRYRFC